MLKQSTVLLGFFLLFFNAQNLFAQKTKRINKWSVGLAIDVGHTFPHFDRPQNRWKAPRYPTGSMTGIVANRLTQKWIVEAGIGGTLYWMVHKGPVDKYILDYASPHFISGISYNMLTKKRQEQFFKLSGGMQVGYQGEFVDEFETYTILVEGQNRILKFIRPEIGIRRFSTKRAKGTRDKIAFEYSLFFRYNFDKLGLVKIEEEDFEVYLNPRGNIVGASFRLVFPTGSKRMKVKDLRVEPVIYHPRG